MNSRERVIQAINHKLPDRVHRDMGRSLLSVNGALQPLDCVLPPDAELILVISMGGG